MLFPNIYDVVMSLGRITPSGVSLLGTAFLLNVPGNLVTAAHVVNNDDNGLVVIVNDMKNLYDYQDTTETQIHYLSAKITKINPLTDICIIEIDQKVASNLKISGFDSICVGEQITLFGFPHADHGRRVLTQQDTEIGAKILINTNGIKTKHVVLNIQSRPGQSGSPIISKKDLSLIGMLIGSYAPTNSSGSISIGGIDPQTLHQTTQAISAEYIAEMFI